MALKSKFAPLGDEGIMKIRYYGHSCFLIETEGAKILFDPFITPNELAKHININDIHCTHICVSHGHGDHVADLITLAKQNNAQVIGSYELTEWVKRQGHTSVHPLNTGGKWNFGSFVVKMTYAAHSNSLPDGTYGGLAGGFLFRAEGKTLYYAGDTALTMDMKLLGELEKIDLALLPIGDNFTMNIDDAVIASDFIRCNQVIGMHFDTFGFIKIDHEEAHNKFAEKGKTLSLMGIGEYITL